MVENKKPRFFYGYIIVLAAFFIMLLISGALNSFGVFFKPLVTEFGWTLGSAIGPVLAGYIFDITGNYNLAFLIFAVVSIMALILVLLLRPPGKEGRFNHD